MTASYDFATLHPAWGADAPMWERLRRETEPTAQTVELGVAEMKFLTAPEIVSAAVEQAQNGTFGYSGPSAALQKSICSWMLRRHGWAVEPDWIFQTYGLVTAIGCCIRALTEPGDGVLINFPAYGPFPGSVRDNGRRVVRSDLVLRDGRWVMDLEDMERKLSDPGVKLYILCNPHNPTGRVWTQAELSAVSELCLRRGVTVLSDEIHFDIVFPPNKHRVFASLSPETAAATVTLTAPSKTFNIAGMTISNVIISDEALRLRVRELTQRETGHYINSFGFAVCRAAYENAAPWLEECLGVLKGNCEYFRDFLAQRVPVFSCQEQEGTYLVWMDCSRAGMTEPELHDFLWREAGFYSQAGSIFGEGYECFQRVNLACPRQYVEAACERLEAASRARGII